MQQQQEGGRALDCLLRQPCKLYNQLSEGGGGWGVVHGNSSTTGAVHNAGAYYRGGSTLCEVTCGSTTHWNRYWVSAQSQSGKVTNT